MIAITDLNFVSVIDMNLFIAEGIVPKREDYNMSDESLVETIIESGGYIFEFELADHSGEAEKINMTAGEAGNMAIRTLAALMKTMDNEDPRTLAIKEMLETFTDSE